MRFTKKQAFIHLAQRKQEGEKDIVDKFKIIKILREEFGLHGLTDEVLIINEDCCHLPDIFIKTTNPEIVIELDGELHGDGEPISKLARDAQRDEDYARVGVKLVIINKQQTGGYQKEKVIRVLEKNGLIRK